MRKKRMGLLAVAAVVAAVVAALVPVSVSAASKAEEAATATVEAVTKAKEGDTVEFKNRVIATYDSKLRMVYKPSTDPTENTKALNYLLDGDDEKTLIIPSGKTVKMDGLIWLGSNTTIIAKGATIVQTTEKKGLLTNVVDGYNYNALQNVTINGGTWKSKKFVKGEWTMFRFTHASDITIKNATVCCNYQGHALELIACKNVKVNKCTLKAMNAKTKEKTSVEEAVQIDLATPTTAPGVKKELEDAGRSVSKYLNGQTCKNITITNSTVSGSRGICANYSKNEEKYLGKYHTNVTIKNCTVTGMTAEGIALFNTVGVTLANNKIKTTSKRNGESYANALTMILYKKNSKASSYKTKITGNTFYGVYRGMMIHSSGSSKYGATTITKNKIYTKGDKKEALSVSDCKSVKKGSNTIKKWK